MWTKGFGHNVAKCAKYSEIKSFKWKDLCMYLLTVFSHTSLQDFLTYLSLNAKEKMELQFDTDITFLLCPSSSAFLCFHPYTHYN